MKQELSLFKIDVEKKIVLYAPTWRGLVGKIEKNIEKLVEDISIINEHIGEEYELIVKLHTLQYKFIKGNDKFKQIKLIPDYMDVNEVLSVVDILITDYSSIFFDFLITGKPIIYYMYDKDKYFEEIGSYIDLENERLPGPICKNVNQVIEAIGDIDNYNKNYEGIYKIYQNKYCSNLKGNNTKKIVDYIFKGYATIEPFSCYNKDKKHILIYAGGFLNNGITTSLVNLLNYVDYDRYTVTIIESDIKNDIREKNLTLLNPNVKLLFRGGKTNHKFREAYQNRWILRMGLSQEFSKKIFPTKLYEREYRRIFGQLKFDIAIDYSGYVPFWSLIFSHCKAIKKAYIYQHNDMFSEYNKVIQGKLKHRDNLKIIFSIYERFNKVLAVSKLTMELNKEKISRFCNVDNFDYVNNLLDAEKILDNKDHCVKAIVNKKKYIVINDIVWGRKQTVTLIEDLDPEFINLVTIGRLSPEKDHKKLINAFKIMSEENENIRLYIVGDGVEYKAIQQQINNLNLTDRVILTGQLSNPFYILNKADAFILSSNSEGQPMVLLEALALGKKIIATNIQANIDVLQGGLGELVDNSVEGLVEGMRKLINNEIEKHEFDMHKYNERAFELIQEKVLR